jgi:O-antigen ligase
MENFGGVFGMIGLLSIIYLVSRPILQAVVERMRKNGKTLPSWLKKVYQFVNKTHRNAGFVAVGAIIIHFTLQYSRYGEIPVAGLIAGLALAAQSVLGFGLTKQKDKEIRKKMALLHRAVGMVVVVAVLVHRLG